MTDIEFELLDQLYFVQTIDSLCNDVNMSNSEIVIELKRLFDKEWIKILDSDSETEITDPALWGKDLTNFYYLITKKGLFAHNTL